MHTLDTLSDDALLAAFLAFDIPASNFDHRAHLRIAWIHLQRYPLAEAVERTCSGIADFAAHLGATKKFNRTLTEALVRLMANAGATNPTLDWEDFLAANPELRGNAKELITRYYSPERLAQPEARDRFLAPDKTPLPT